MNDEFFMKAALEEARAAVLEGEIPVGAVIVKEGKILGRGRNFRKRKGSPLGHAEIAALEDAAQNTGSWRFDGCTIYVTLEPCVMCTGAIVQCRLSRIVYGARDPKAGGCGSLYEIARDPRMYHRCQVVSGIFKKEASELLREYFAAKRKRTGLR